MENRWLVLVKLLISGDKMWQQWLTHGSQMAMHEQKLIIVHSQPVNAEFTDAIRPTVVLHSCLIISFMFDHDQTWYIWDSNQLSFEVSTLGQAWSSQPITRWVVVTPRPNQPVNIRGLRGQVPLCHKLFYRVLCGTNIAINHPNLQVIQVSPRLMHQSIFMSISLFKSIHIKMHKQKPM